MRFRVLALLFSEKMKVSGRVFKHARWRYYISLVPRIIKLRNHVFVTHYDAHLTSRSVGLATVRRYYWLSRWWMKNNLGGEFNISKLGLSVMLLLFPLTLISFFVLRKHFFLPCCISTKSHTSISHFNWNIRFYHNTKSNALGVTSEMQSYFNRKDLQWKRALERVSELDDIRYPH